MAREKEQEQGAEIKKKKFIWEAASLVNTYSFKLGAISFISFIQTM